MSRRAADSDLPPGTVPTFVDKATLARELSIGETTADEWIADGTLPAPHIRKGRVHRWHWATILARFAPKPQTVVELDPYLHGVQHGQEKGVRRDAP